jgi:hypothetical protein
MLEEAARYAAKRVSSSLYMDLRQWLLENDPDAPKMLGWATYETGLPETPDHMAGEIIWTILCAGRSAQAARTIEKRVWGAIRAGQPVVTAFGYRAKAAAMERAWNERERDFKALRLTGIADVEKLLSWCRSIPYIGDDTQFQLAKNFGADLCKPDIWLCRLAGLADRPRRNVSFRFRVCMALCQNLSMASGDRIAAVDSLLWLACNKRILQVDSEAGQITFRPGKISAKPILGHVTTGGPA